MTPRTPLESGPSGQTEDEPSGWEVLSSENPADQRRISEIMNKTRVRTDTKEFADFLRQVLER